MHNKKKITGFFKLQVNLQINEIVDIIQRRNSNCTKSICKSYYHKKVSMDNSQLCPDVKMGIFGS